MKKCPGCGYVWADDYSGQCLECGKPLGGISPNGGGDLNFRYAAQMQRGIRENQIEAVRKSGAARPGDVYDRAEIEDGILNAARRMLVQREEVRYEED